MMQSMTGYGRAFRERGGSNILVELRALNSRYCDLSVKLPNSYRGKDLEIRSLLATALIRGKIDLTITVTGGADTHTIDIPLVKSYFAQLSALARELQLDTSQLMPTVMQMPGVIDAGGDELDDAAWASSLGAIHEAIDQLHRFRKNEGKAMQADLEERLTGMSAGLAEVARLDPQRHERIRKRMGDGLAAWLRESEYDANRFEQELLYYVEKMDINEEMVRLKAHIDHFKEEMNSAGSDLGKVLGFIAQEMGREVNTISSKANDAAMQKIVVRMKDELEKIKELLLNVL